MSNLPLIVCLMGPTASGKTALALELVQFLPFEIISVDSGMIYRGMDIGTAKPTHEELRVAPHHLIDILDPSEPYSVGQFCHDSKIIIDDILARKKIPLLVGGTMMYFRMLQQGIARLPQADASVRQKINLQAAAEGWKNLYKKLVMIDPVAAKKISSADTQRIQRALEIHEITGKTVTELQSLPFAPLPYRVLNFALIPDDREMLWQRIQLRFKKMLQAGFVSEVECLYRRGNLNINLPSMRAVGYRQVWQYLAGAISFTAMQELIPIATRQLAKRQLTWLRKWNDVTYLDIKNILLKETIKDMVEQHYLYSQKT